MFEMMIFFIGAVFLIAIFIVFSSVSVLVAFLIAMFTHHPFAFCVSMLVGSGMMLFIARLYGKK